VRVSAIDRTLLGDYDEQRRRVRLRAATTKTRKALWIELPPVLADAIEATIGPREDRDPDARLFAASGADALRRSMAEACRAVGIPILSPHDLRHRRISLLHLRGVPWARIGKQSASATSPSQRTPTDETELNYHELVALAA
jgi:integrase